MKNLINRFVTEEDGMEILEWAIVAVLFAVVAGAAFQGIGTEVLTKLKTVTSVFTAPSSGTP